MAWDRIVLVDCLDELVDVYLNSLDNVRSRIVVSDRADFLDRPSHGHLKLQVQVARKSE